MNTGDALYESYKKLGISGEVLDFSKTILKELESRFAEIDEIAEYNQMKVLQAMQKNKVSEMHLEGSTGYGYTEPGRDTLEAVYADVFHTEDALVRAQIACGTHALTVALFGNLRPGDELLSISGKPYDTLEGCLSLTGVRPATRYKRITVVYQDERFRHRTEKFSGFTAQIIQHEIDHCNGVLI